MDADILNDRGDTSTSSFTRKKFAAFDEVVFRDDVAGFVPSEFVMEALVCRFFTQVSQRLKWGIDIGLWDSRG